MIKSLLILTLSLSVLAFAEMTEKEMENLGQKTEDKKNTNSEAEMTKEKVNEHVSDWSEPSKKVTSFMLEKYGMPSGMTDSMLVWENTKPFKRSIVYKEAVDHNFPMKHKDVLEQVVDYKAPNGKQVEKVWNYDGSVFLRRTSGEMAAMCDMEEANFLALNLADEVITGEKSVEDARTEYAQQILLVKNNKPTEYVQKLLFDIPSKAGDADEAIMDRIDKQKVLAE